MKTSEKFIITINREFGSAGHEIGALLAKRLNVKLIDKQVLEAMTEKYSVTEKEIKKIESRRPSWWDDFANFYQAFMNMNEYHVNAKDITSRQLFFAESKIMKDIAAQESCVIVGRSAFNIFKDIPNVLEIFIHSDLSLRVKRIMTKYKISEENARDMINDNDYQRELFTKTFTGKSRYDARNYDVCIDSGKIGVEATVDYILDYIRIQN